MRASFLAVSLALLVQAPTALAVVPVSPTPVTPQSGIIAIPPGEQPVDRWSKLEDMHPPQIPVIINYQITSKGARIFGEMAGAHGGVELSDNGVSLGRVPVLMNSYFDLPLPAPLDLSKDHAISIRGWDMMGEPIVLPTRENASPDRKQYTISFTKTELAQQQTSLQDLQKSAPTAAPSTVGSASPTDASAMAAAAAKSSRLWLIVLIFVIVLALAIAAYVLARRRKGGA